jgi:hypothetical protein
MKAPRSASRVPNPLATASVEPPALSPLQAQVYAALVALDAYGPETLADLRAECAKLNAVECRQSLSAFTGDCK